MDTYPPQKCRLRREYHSRCSTPLHFGLGRCASTARGFRFCGLDLAISVP